MTNLVRILLEENARANSQTTGPSSASGSAAAAPVSCRHCTFTNPPGIESCEMCGLPLSG